MKNSPVVPITLAVTVVMLLTTAQISGMNIAIAGKYTKSQSSSQLNDCGNGIFSLSVLCQNLESVIQGEGNAINIIGVQTGGEFGLDKINSEWLSGVDEQQLLSAFEWLKVNGIDKELLSGSGGYGGGFVLILVLFILLVIIGAGFGGG